jgi:6-phosphogluconolactonase
MADRKLVTVVPDSAALARAAADHVVAVLADALAHRDLAHVALAGGSTPRAVNALLVAAPRRDTVDWSRVIFWFGDERCVPPDDADSNYRMNCETLLDPLGVPLSQVHRMHGEDDPSAAGADYDVVLKRELGLHPRLDLIQLGMGPEGHTASLFPGTTTDIDKDKDCIAHYVPQLAKWRITLTPRAINAARNVAITAGGAEKADALRAVLDGPREPDVYPAQIVNPHHGELRWLVDAAAAAHL